MPSLGVRGIRLRCFGLPRGVLVGFPSWILLVPVIGVMVLHSVCTPCVCARVYAGARKAP